MKRAIVYASVLFTLPLATFAADTSITLPTDNVFASLKPAQGVEIARINCGSCHSTDYIVAQPRGGAKQWEGVVTKMIKTYGAAISDADAKAITEYLASAYGPTN